MQIDQCKDYIDRENCTLIDRDNLSKKIDHDPTSSLHQSDQTFISASEENSRQNQASNYINYDFIRIYILCLRCRFASDINYNFLR